MLKQLKYVLLYVRDPQASLQFYRDVLGLREVFNEKGEGVAGVAIGDIEFILHVFNPEKTTYDCSKSGMILEFAVDDVDGFFSVLKSRGATSMKPPRDMSFGLRQLYVEDPDRHLLCFSAPIAKSNQGLS